MIWNAATDLVHAGGVDAWDFKQYVLGTMFYRYISENITEYINEGERKAGDVDFDYARLPDEVAEQARHDLVEEKGFSSCRPSCSATFAQGRRRMKRSMKRSNASFILIENSAQGSESEDAFKGLFDDFDVNSNKLGATVAKRNEKLVKLLDTVADMKLGKYQDSNDRRLRRCFTSI